VLAALSVVVALAVALGADGGLSRGRMPDARAAPLDAPVAAPDNSIVLQQFLSGFSFPVFMTHAGDGTNWLWVVEKAGLIKLVVNGNVRQTPFLDLVDTVSVVGEQGLLGLAFHPLYETNGRFFVYYTAKPSGSSVGNNTLAEYHVDESNPHVANPAPVRVLLSIPDGATNHNGGTIAFGQDGKLYIATGDSGASAATAQDPMSLFGKVLRIDVDTPGTPQPPGFGYSIPPDNPFVGNPAYRPEIWALGLRNPYRWSFDRQTGDMLVADVGAVSWEEVSFLPRGVGGLNLGWVIREGKHCTPPATTCSTAGLTDPILEYDHSLGCAIAGGYRYRGGLNPALRGIYFYGDFCSGRVWKGIASGRFWGAIEALDTDHNITSFGEDEAGELYVVAASGQILRLLQAPSPPVANCSQRPRIDVRTVRVAPGTLQVTLTATNSATVASNVLQSIVFNHIVNGSVTIGAQSNQTSPFSVTLPPSTTSAQFTAARTQAGQVLHVDFSVTDLCGPWQTFVGGGTSMP
jgi:glucose/arabinose dehydrogenase